MSEETPLAVTPAVEADPTTKIEAPAPPEPEVAAKSEAEAEAGEVVDDKPEGETEPKKKVPGSQRLKRRLDLIEADYLALQQETERLKQERQPAKPENGGRPGIDREPLDTDFPNDWYAFQEAKSAWAATQAVRNEFNRVRDEESRRNTDRVQTERRREVLEAYHEYADEVRERISDFDKVIATAENVPVKRELGDLILESDKAALLQYHLARNPDKAKELNQLSGRELAKAIGRLEATVHLPKAKKATDADPPPAEVRGAAAAPVDPRTGPDDINAYAAWRKKQEAARA